MRYVRITDLVYILVSTIGAIVSNFVPVSDYSAYKYLSIILLFETISFLIANKKRSGSLVDFSTVFMLLVLLFNFGQVFLLGWFPSFLVNKTVVLTYFSIQEAFDACVWMNYTYVIIGAFILLNNQPQKVKINNTDKGIIPENHEYLLRKCYYLICMTLPIKLFVDINYLVRSFLVGFEYGKSWLNSFPNFVTTIGNFSMIGFAFLIVLHRNSPRKQLKTFIVAAVYLFVLMLSGRRSENVAYLCVMLILLLLSRNEYTQKKLRLKHILLLVPFGYFVLLFLYTVVRIRGESAFSVSNFFDSMQYYHIHDNILIEQIREYGQTGYTAISVLTRWLPNYNPSYGTSYIYGISSVFPNIGGLMGELTEASNFGLTLARTDGVLNSMYRNIRGSVLGEFFFNFGKIGALFAAGILGTVIGKTNTKVISYIRCDAYNLIYTIPVMFSTIYWIRDYFGDTIRDIVWGVLFCYILLYIKTDKRGRI